MAAFFLLKSSSSMPLIYQIILQHHKREWVRDLPHSVELKSLCCIGLFFVLFSLFSHLLLSDLLFDPLFLSLLLEFDSCIVCCSFINGTHVVNRKFVIDFKPPHLSILLPNGERIHKLPKSSPSNSFAPEQPSVSFHNGFSLKNDSLTRFISIWLYAFFFSLFNWNLIYLLF